jgi:hypothetical protein
LVETINSVALTTKKYILPQKKQKKKAIDKIEKI